MKFFARFLQIFILFNTITMILTQKRILLNSLFQKKELRFEKIDSEELSFMRIDQTTISISWLKISLTNLIRITSRFLVPRKILD